MKLPQTVRWATGIPWQWKVFIPIIGVLALSLVVVTLVLRTLEIENAQWILLAALGFAILLCFVLLSVLLVLVERPLQELMETIDRVRHGDLSTRVGFAKRDDDIGRLGRQFNEMVEQLNESRRKLEEFHQREMARAQHLATLGELATGLAHEIRNPLAGIAGVVDVMSKDLPANSPSRAVMRRPERDPAYSGHSERPALLRTAPATGFPPERSERHDRASSDAGAPASPQQAGADP